MSVEDVDVEDVDVSVEDLEKELDDLPDVEDEGITEESDDEGNESEEETTVEDPPEKVDPPAEEPPPEQKDHSVPLAVMLKERDRANELQRRLDEADKTPVVETPEPKAPELPELKPLTEEEIEEITDDLGESEAKRQVAQREREIAREVAATAENQALKKELAELKSVKETESTRASLADAPELLKWFDGAAKGNEEDVARIQLAEDYMPAASRLHPNDIPAQNAFIQSRVIADLKIQVTPEKKPVETKEDVSIDNLPGGAQVGGGSDREFIARMDAKDPDNWTDAEIERMDQISFS